jgi:hypothetical protein
VEVAHMGEKTELNEQTKREIEKARQEIRDGKYVMLEEIKKRLDIDEEE